MVVEVGFGGQGVESSPVEVAHLVDENSRETSTLVKLLGVEQIDLDNVRCKSTDDKGRAGLDGIPGRGQRGKQTTLGGLEMIVAGAARDRWRRICRRS